MTRSRGRERTVGRASTLFQACPLSRPKAELVQESHPARPWRPPEAPHLERDAYGARGHRIPRKEVIQPQLPLRLPCYDFTPVTDSTFDCSLPCGLGHRLRVFPASVV